MGRSRQTDGVEAVVRKADETLEDWLRRGARVLRQQVSSLQFGLKKVSTGLEQLERERKPATTKPRRVTVGRKPARSRKPKKAA
jgi:hypothetical protein